MHWLHWASFISHYQILFHIRYRFSHIGHIGHFATHMLARLILSHWWCHAFHYAITIFYWYAFIDTLRYLLILVLADTVIIDAIIPHPTIIIGCIVITLIFWLHTLHYYYYLSYFHFAFPSLSLLAFISSPILILITAINSYWLRHNDWYCHTADTLPLPLYCH